MSGGKTLIQNLIAGTVLSREKMHNLGFDWPGLKSLPLLLLLLLVSLWPSSAGSVAAPPLPMLPIPSAKQISWQAGGERALFFHFGINTFTDSEWGTGKADPSLFNPSALDARQWARTAKCAGFSRVILTAKHHDGFCLWPSQYTNYSVASSPWKNGSGDVVAALAQAAQEEGLSLGLYLSPWDRHESSYGRTLEYNEFYLALLRELLTGYGPIAEVWLDGAKGKDAPDMVYFFEGWFSIIRQLQPGAVIFSDAGPDARWVGNEDGQAGSTCWAMLNSSSITIGGALDASYSEQGDPNGIDWVPAECDVSIRPGWFWHKNEQPDSVNTLLQIYYESVGRNCVLLLNVPPNSTGLIPEPDMDVLNGFNQALESIFSVNLAANASASADSLRGPKFGPSQVLREDLSTYWAPESGKTSGYLEFDMGVPITFNVARMQEAVGLGQRVMQYHVDALKDGGWITVGRGTTIGYKKLDRMETTQAQVVRLYIDAARAEPLIACFGLHLDPITRSEPHTPPPPYRSRTRHISAMRRTARWHNTRETHYPV